MPGRADLTEVHDRAYEELLDRLTADDGGADDATADVVLAAAEGADALAAFLDGGEPPPRRTGAPAEDVTPARVYLDEIAVTGFRGVGPRARLPLTPGPGLTLVVGRNGSGKSSFAEGLELLLTDTNLRWDGKTKVWRDGWRCLHGDGPVTLEATFRVDGEAEPLRVARTWAADDALDAGPGRTVSGPATGWADLGWDAALVQHRPLLSYNELQTMFSDRAAQLYEALSAVLGLEDVDQLTATLRAVRLEREKSDKQEKALRTALTAALRASGDARAAVVLAALAPRTPDLDAIEAHLAAGPDDGTDVAALHARAGRPVPTSEQIAATQRAAAEAGQALEAARRDQAQRSDAIAALLEGALQLHAAHGDGDCPVCGNVGALDGSWSLRAQADLEGRRRAAQALRGARARVQQADAALRALFPHVVGSAEYDAWAGDPADATKAETLRALLEGDRDDAARQLAQRDDAWKPVAAEARRWMVVAAQARADKAAIARVKAAEAWMRTTAAALRAQRLAPVVDAAQANWQQLRHESNVELGEVTLTKTGNQRYAAFDVTVDGTGASAYGVMSQGELSALAISVFLPRATLDASPFGFVVIDDPVQSMDPAKVDGLARVLAAAAEDRQVVVFTHDDRLPQAVERLGLPARVVDVKRRARSKVEVVAGRGPVERYLDEAFAVARTDELPDAVRARVVPGFCRSAIEAACATAIRRRGFAAGRPHAEIEQELDRRTSLMTWLQGALGLGTAQGREVFPRLRALGGEEAARVVELVRQGSHTLVSVDAVQLTRATERLARKLEAAP